MITVGEFGLAVRGPGVVDIILTVSYALLAGATTMVAVLFLSRVLKSWLERKEESLRRRYQEILNKVIVNATFSERGSVHPAFEFYMAELRLCTGNSAFAKEILIQQMLTLKRNLSGNSARALVRAYHEIPLYPESRRKLGSSRWHVTATGIRALFEMEHVDSVEYVRPFLHSRNHLIRAQSFLALTGLEKEPLKFLGGFRGFLSRWIQINLYRYLSGVDTRRIPSFRQWFGHADPSVRRFAIRMATQFRQQDALPSLADLLYEADASIVGHAVHAIGELEGFEHRHVVVRLLAHAWPYPSVAQKTLECLIKIGDPSKDAHRVARYLDHPSGLLRSAAVRTLKAFGDAGDEVIQLHDCADPGRLKDAISHFSDPIISAA